MKLTCPLQKIHFVGIGGIGMSAIAEMLADLGVQVQGSDEKESANTKRVRENGIPVFIGHSAENLQGVDAIVVSSAIQPDNPELVAAQKMGIPIGHRSEMLAEILQYKQSICVSGTHGKTTTSSLIASVLMTANFDPSFVIGGILNAQHSNARLGKGNYVVVEADESDGSFLKLPTNISVITNIDAEHMDFYKTFDNMKAAYLLFMRNTAFYGACIACIDNPVLKEVVTQVQNRYCITYGLDKSAMVRAENIRTDRQGMKFDVVARLKDKTYFMTNISLAMFGLHNVVNALAAVSVGLYLGVSERKIIQALSEFGGIQRRLTYRGQINAVSVYDDYGHHPTEIAATLKAVRESTQGKVIAVFQPHRYTRLRDLWDGFLACFENADVVYVCDVYSAGEEPIEGVTAPTFAQVLSQTHGQVKYLPVFDDLVNLTHGYTMYDTLVCLGAGSISSQITTLISSLKG
ncbi:MAG: UDP-N-acetylmuramate--L-alanine ligase [Alphaproteobacteria bacterium]|nr:UDP-N-acetylmuramate--L-alanine ligase [Alphaproteobacteria bacterium]MBQ3117786.1 UDP-N-acetylmuramate--L-alanine ligase [Alphaproteobacteria bacterium]MBQ8557639.1 UDP-N-acetylmuramate--L-alanine ligase [Alphaproteobacteria bacterium]MBR3913906.1 UDP-N-acetylmuramate--L-alanine ligase [Alphaproteobacteria bacterium]